MSRKKTASSSFSPPTSATASWLRRYAFWLALGLAAVATIGTVSYLTRATGNGSATAAAPTPQPIAPTVQKAFTLGKLLTMKPEELKDVDIAEMNLLCATGLPGAEKLDIAHCLATLDQWAERAQYETTRYLYRATDPRYAEHFHHSEAYLRAEMLMQTLCEDCGVKYNLAVKDSFDFNDSRVAFIHGMIPASGQTIAETPGGTCASMPVMCVAVGRRLGYPLKLVTTKAHVFVRWEGKDNPNPAWRERFNMEVTHGFSSYSDDYYKTWPFQITDAEVKANGWLVSLTPKEEFAEFLASRGHCAIDNGSPGFAARCFENAYRYDTTRPCYRNWFLDAVAKSDYKPFTPALAGLIKERAGLSDIELNMAKQEAAARREWFRTHQEDPMTGGLPPGLSVGWPSAPGPGIPQPPPSYAPQPGIPQSRQPWMPDEPPAP